MGYLSCSGDSARPICESVMPRKIKGSSSKVRDEDEVKEFSYSEVQLATRNFSKEMFLGKGSHGRVYRAVFNGGRLVAAVKKTKGYKSATSPAENEMEILSKVRNSGLVNLIGFCIDSEGEKLIVVEYMPNGTLYDLLHKKNKPLGWRKRVRLGLEIAKAVESLHSASPPVIHRDIKSSNVMLDGKLSARLGDFGLALRGQDARVKCTPPAGTLGYLDPSYLVPEDLSTKSDVFSFGILLLEIMSGRNAIDLKYSPPSIIDWAIPLIKEGDFETLCDRRIGPPTDMRIVRQLGLLASRCVAVEARRRPEMGEVVACLKKIRNRVRSSSSKSSAWSNFTKCVRRQDGSDAGGQLAVSDMGDEEQGTAVVDAGRRGSRVRLSISELKTIKVRPRGEGMVRSRSVGSVDEMRKLASKKKQEPAMKMRAVRLSKSRSAGVLHGRNLTRFATEMEDAAGDRNSEEREPLISTLES